MQNLIDLKERFVKSFVCDGWIFKAFVLIWVASFSITIVWVDVERMYAAWLAFAAYILSSIVLLWYLYGEDV